MSDNEIFEYNLSSEDKKQSLKLSLSEDKILIILESKSDTNEKYSTLISLPQLAKLSEAFDKMNSLKEALIILTDTIESGNIYLINGQESIIIKFKIKTEKKEYPPFQIELSLNKETNNNEKIQEQEQKENYEVLPIKFDYQGNKEAEEKYGKITENTTEYNKPIIESDYKEPIVQLEYIEPILQVHYPDGTTKSKALPPRIQTIDGKTPNLSEEQFRYIREQMNRSVEKEEQEKESHYSISTVPVPSFDNVLSAIALSGNDNINNNDNVKIKENQQEQQAQAKYQQQNNINNNINNSTSQYSIRTVMNKPLYQNNNNINNVYNKSNIQHRSPPRNKTIEFIPRMKQTQTQTQTNTINKINLTKYNQYQNAISKSQINQASKNPLTKNFKGFATVIPLKQIKRPIAQSQVVTHPKKNIINTPFEFSSAQQKARFESQLKMQQAIIDQKTPKFPSALPTQIMEMKYEYPQGINYEEQLLSKIKAQDQSNQILNKNINIQVKNEQNLEEKDNKEETLENNEVIEDEENNEENKEQTQENQENQENQQEDYEALYKTEEGFIIFRNGILRGIIHQYSEIDEIISKIQDKLSKGAKFNLLYKAFSDGDKASIFHEKCDNHPISLVLIETTDGVRFGGFTKKSWEGKNIKKIDNDAFVFSIETGKCYDVKHDEPAVGCYPKFGPVFFGCQIRIYDEFFTKGGTTCLRGLNYKTTKDFELNNGQRNFVVKDIEVYEIETIDV